MPTRSVRTTITVPEDLLEAADRAVREGKARSRSELVVEALRRELAEYDRAAIDEAFAALAGDDEFQSESVALSEEGIPSGWEALRLGEREV